MREYCGCQALTTMADLTREHDRALDFIRDSEQAARDDDPASARLSCSLLQTLLAPHTEVEEPGLFRPG